MKHHAQPTSILAYAEILEDLGWRQRQVYQIIRKLKSCNNLQISQELHLPINRITPRVKELRDYGIVMQHKKDICKETGKLVIFWKPRRWDW